jgi:hypothetical protein
MSVRSLTTQPSEAAWRVHVHISFKRINFLELKEKYFLFRNYTHSIDSPFLDLDSLLVLKIPIPFDFLEFKAFFLS